jgi:hypothetical protein
VLGIARPWPRALLCNRALREKERFIVRRFVLFGLSIAAIAIALGGYAMAQDTATPGAEGTPVDLLCATPVSDAAGQGEQMAVVVTAPETAATPGGAERGSPVGLFPAAPRTPLQPQSPRVPAPPKRASSSTSSSSIAPTSRRG